MAENDDSSSTPEKSIRDSIEEAIETVGEPEAPPQRPARPAPVERDEYSEGIEERPRDDRGRFVKPGEDRHEEPSDAQKQPPQRPQRAPDEKPEQAPVQEPPKEPETREQRLAKLTKNWRAEQKQFLAQQSPEVQDFLISRDQEMGGAYLRKTQRLATLESEYGPIHQMLEPELPAIKAAGYTPRLLIEGWANAERALLSGPQQAATTLRTIAEGYQIPREIVAAAFGFDPRTPEQIAWGGAGQPQHQQEIIPPNGNGAQYYHDPRVDQLLAERQDYQERAVIARNQQFRQAANNAMAEINQFREAVDARGNLVHPYFAEVENYMTALAKFHGESTGKIPPLQELYDSAVNANPATRARLVADTQRVQSDRQRQAVAARGKADQARRASSSIVGMGSPRPTNRMPGQPLPRGASVRDSIHAAIDEVTGDRN
jgi:hypothetical protein